jgi:methyl-accepting chemotaxis protein
MVHKNKNEVSMMRRLVVFSVLLYLVILVAGALVFTFAMSQIVNENIAHEMSGVLDSERLMMEGSVGKEIAIALKMANSPLIQEYFKDPDDPALEKIAFREIAAYRRAFASNSIFWVNDRDKKFYSDDKYVYTVDPKNSADYWYSMTLNETKTYNFNINYNPELKKINLWINAPVFDEKGKPIGILGTGIDLTAFVNMVYANYKGKAALYLFNADKEITGAKNTELVTAKKKIDEELGATGADIFATAKELKPDEIKSFPSPIGVVSVGTIPDLNWYIVSVMPVGIENYENTMTVFFFVVLAVVALIFIAFNLFFSALFRPLQKMVNVLRQITSNRDLTKQIEIHRQDEIGMVVNAVNEFFGKIRDIIRGLHSSANTLANTSEELSIISNQIANDSEKALNQNNSIANTTKSMTASIDSMANSTERISTEAEGVASAAEQMSENMNTVAGAVEEMSVSINEIAGNTNEVHSIATTAASKATDATTVINKLGVAAEEIGRVTDIIKRIADKTNLLALNATIEAASAGAAGKGFAVVAGEIKELANQSAQNADDIAQRIEGIQNGTSDAVKVIHDVSDIIGKINQSVETIANHIEQQTKASNQIANNVAQANTSAKRVATSINEVASGITSVSHNAGAVAKNATEVSKHVGDLTVSAKESLMNSKNANQSTLELAKVAEDMRQAVDQFKV